MTDVQIWLHSLLSTHFAAKFRTIHILNYDQSITETCMMFEKGSIDLVRRMIKGPRSEWSHPQGIDREDDWQENPQNFDI